MSETDGITTPDIKRPRTAKIGLTVATLLLPAAAWMTVFYATPLATMVWTGLLQPASGAHEDLFASPLYLGVFWTTLQISAITTVGSLLLGYPVAYALVMTSGAKRSVILLLVSLPYWLDYIVRSYSWMVLLGRHGIVNNALVALGIIHQPVQLLYNLFSVCVGMIQVQLPMAILTLFAAMLRVDRTLMSAATIHGASDWRAFRSVFVPLSLPGVYAASLLVFISSLGFYIIPALIGGAHQTMISQSIVTLANTLLRWDEASTLGIILLALSVILTMLYDKLFSLDRLWGELP
jgi:putative spermidine/putrescine transport system permease protein